MLLYIYFRSYIHSPLQLPPALFMDRLLDGWPLGTETSAALFIIDRTAEQLYDFFQSICRGDAQQRWHQQRREIHCFSQALYFMTLLGFHAADIFLSNSPLCWMLISSFIYTPFSKPSSTLKCWVFLFLCLRFFVFILFCPLGTFSHSYGEFFMSVGAQSKCSVIKCVCVGVWLN